MIKVILISGKQGSGKTTISNALKARAKQFKFDFVGSMKFADVLYELHDYLLNKMATYTEKPRIKKDGPLLQWLGTEWGRTKYGPNVWVNILKNKVKFFEDESASLKRLIIIDDCRFENEFDAFPEALRVRLTCSEAERKARADAWRDNTEHPSETGLDVYAAAGKFDLVLNTAGAGRDVEHCVSLIFSELNRGSWIESREPTLHNSN
jgi:hypothetical protein